MWQIEDERSLCDVADDSERSMGDMSTVLHDDVSDMEIYI